MAIHAARLSKGGARAPRKQTVFNVRIYRMKLVIWYRVPNTVLLPFGRHRPLSGCFEDHVCALAGFSIPKYTDTLCGLISVVSVEFSEIATVYLGNRSCGYIGDAG